MVSQLELLVPPAAAQRHSETSKAAAVAIDPDARTLRLKVLHYLTSEYRRSNGATDEEIQMGLGMNPSTQRPRRIELVRLGLVVDSGLTRKTVSGHSATVWKAV